MQQEPGAVQHPLTAGRILLKLGRARQALDLIDDALERHPRERRLQELAELAQEAAQA